MGRPRAIRLAHSRKPRTGPEPSGEELGLEFLEPCIGFDLEEIAGDTAVLRVYLSLEAEPPFIVAGFHGIFENYLRLTMSLTALSSAAADWEAEMQAYPVR